MASADTFSSLNAQFQQAAKHFNDAFIEHSDTLERQQAEIREKERRVAEQERHLLEAIEKLTRLSDESYENSRTTCTGLLSQISLSLKELRISEPQTVAPTSPPKNLEPESLNAAHTPSKPVAGGTASTNTPQSTRRSPKYQEGYLEGVDATKVPSAVEELSDSDVGGSPRPRGQKAGIEAYPDFKPLTRDDTIRSFFEQGPTADVKKHLIEAEHAKNRENGIETKFRIPDKEQQPFFDRAVHILIVNGYMSEEQLEEGLSSGLTEFDIMRLAEQAEAELAGETGETVDRDEGHEDDRPPARHGDVSPAKSATSEHTIPSPNASGRIGGAPVAAHKATTLPVGFDDSEEEEHEIDRMVLAEEDEEEDEYENDHDEVPDEANGPSADQHPHDGYYEEEDEFEDPLEHLPDNAKAPQPQPRHQDPLRKLGYDASTSSEDEISPPFNLNLQNRLPSADPNGDGTPPLSRGGSRPNNLYQTAVQAPHADHHGEDDDYEGEDYEDEDEELDLPVESHAPPSRPPIQASNAKGKMVYSNFDSDSD